MRVILKVRDWNTGVTMAASPLLVPTKIVERASKMIMEDLAQHISAACPEAIVINVEIDVKAEVSKEV